MLGPPGPACCGRGRSPRSGPPGLLLGAALAVWTGGRNLLRGRALGLRLGPRPLPRRRGLPALLPDRLRGADRPAAGRIALLPRRPVARRDHRRRRRRGTRRGPRAGADLRRRDARRLHPRRRHQPRLPDRRPGAAGPGRDGDGARPAGGSIARWIVARGAGSSSSALSDVAYLLQIADGTYVEGGLLDAAWPLGRAAARRRGLDPSAGPALGDGDRGARPAPDPRPGRRGAGRDRHPGGGTLHLGPRRRRGALAAHPAARWSLRMALSPSARARPTSRSPTHEALTDPLTGLGNRRALMADLEEATTRTRRAAGEVCAAGRLRPRRLQGLQRLLRAPGRRRAAAAARRPARGPSPAREDGRGGPTGSAATSSACWSSAARRRSTGWSPAAGASLGERGDGFLVTASQGSVLIPSEARTRETALQLADRRMYANKSRERASAGIAVARRAAERAARDRAAAARAPDRRRRARGRGRRRARGRRRGPRRGLPRGRAPRRRQDGDPRRDPLQTGAARPGRVGVHPQAHADRRTDHRRGAGPGADRATGALEPRALGRQRLPGRAGRPPRSRSDRGSSSSATPTTR